MIRNLWPRHAARPTALLAAVGLLAFAATTTRGQVVAPAGQLPTTAQIVAAAQMAQKPNEHPLAPAIRVATFGLQHIDRDIQDYTATLVKREQVNGVVGDYQYIYIKVRHKPFSVYMYFLGPDEIKGREAMFVEGANDGKLLAHEGKGIRARIGMVKLDPGSLLATAGQRYQITMTGVRVLTSRLIEVAEKDSKYGECDVKFFAGAKINGRVCTCIQVTHPVPRKQFEFNLARVFIDDEIQVPIRYEAYEWPKQPGGPPVLLEEYTYLNMKINVGLTDADFDYQNPNYHFVRK